MSYAIAIKPDGAPLSDDAGLFVFLSTAVVEGDGILCDDGRGVGCPAGTALVPVAEIPPGGHLFDRATVRIGSDGAAVSMSAATATEWDACVAIETESGRASKREYEALERVAGLNVPNSLPAARYKAEAKAAAAAKRARLAKR